MNVEDSSKGHGLQVGQCQEDLVWVAAAEHVPPAPMVPRGRRMGGDDERQMYRLR